MATATRFDAPIDGVLTAEMIRAWEEEGYLILDGYATAQQCQLIMTRSAEIVEENGPSALGEVFDAVGNSHGGDAYFWTAVTKSVCSLKQASMTRMVN